MCYIVLWNWFMTRKRFSFFFDQKHKNRRTVVTITETGNKKNCLSFKPKSLQKDGKRDTQRIQRYRLITLNNIEISLIISEQVNYILG